MDADVLVVGAGAVGLSCGFALSRTGSVIVLEAEPRIGAGVSSRNSEVVHAGLYYPTGSLKARLCVEGRRRLYAFLDAHGVPYLKCGKLVVAPDAADEPALERVVAQARLNGVEGLEVLTGVQARALEPELRASAALWSPETGIFDSHGYMMALQGRIEDAGGTVVAASPFLGAAPLAGGGWRVRVGGAEPTEVKAGALVLAPGLSAQRAAAAVEGFPSERIPPGRLGKGSYFVLRGPAPFRRLVYPPPVPGALGVHYKRDLAGVAHFGPDLEYVETETYTVDPARADGFYAYVRRFWPGLPDGALEADYAGIRPKLHGPGEPQPDFQVLGPQSHGLPGLVALFGIESPGLTASLALGEHVRALLIDA